MSRENDGVMRMYVYNMTFKAVALSAVEFVRSYLNFLFFAGKGISASRFPSRKTRYHVSNLHVESLPIYQGSY